MVPKRPARELLEVLLAGIHACRLRHNEYDGLNDEDDLDGDAEDWDDEQAETAPTAQRRTLRQLVREAAAAIAVGAGQPHEASDLETVW
ncbi:hypothetical protein [Kitasatospora sp. NPDC001683]